MFKDPKEFNATNVYPRTTAKEALEEFHKHVKFGVEDLILDVGSGSGNVTSEILVPFIPHHNFHLIGVDILKTMVDFANKNVEDPRISFRVLDITEKNEERLKSVFTEEELKKGFNLVFSFNCIHWTQDYQQCYKNMFTLLRPGGQIFVRLSGFSPLCVTWKSIYNDEKWQPYLKSIPLFQYLYHNSTNTKTECIDLLKKIGFEDVICDCVRKPFPPDVPWKDVIAYIDPHIHQIPEHLRSEYKDDLLQLFNQYKEKDPAMYEDRIVLIATKPMK